MYNNKITKPNNANNILTRLVVTGNGAVSMVLVCGFLSSSEMMMAATNNTAKM